ncbi:hypothetical protein Mp_2g07510 [Marchantia polymorpha subsp. ruderalis]|uniref:Uncharacterized protein n=1 Tax=Marchantia polymorpha TaxID=3197 RepID=A0A2R6XGK3_MARPO|nr:hypothetical protein MARPO_0015s0037 [Marchantia polymorpha]BBN01454.1 hypothetical protein Mp_2g07510 [Marchantia polymorpha subsp. ruderalis]|eukprot:PTQ45221.1 hypothetical protein MARPO_0015s0037 [Marchantia polymorpha]
MVRVLRTEFSKADILQKRVVCRLVTSVYHVRCDLGSEPVPSGWGPASAETRIRVPVPLQLNDPGEVISSSGDHPGPQKPLPFSFCCSRLSKLSVLGCNVIKLAPITLLPRTTRSTLHITFVSVTTSHRHVELRLRQEDQQWRQLRLQLQGVRALLLIRDEHKLQGILLAGPRAGRIQGGRTRSTFLRRPRAHAVIHQGTSSDGHAITW